MKRLQRLGAAARMLPGMLQKNAKRIILAAVILLLWIFSFAGVYKLAQYSDSWSLRYHTPISGETARAVRQYAVEQPQSGLWPTFWREDDLTLESELAQVTAPGILFSGEGGLVWPARFLQGGWPGATDEAGCVISKELAWQLWGSYDVVGKELTWAGKPYFVRGVMEESEALCLLSLPDAASATGWQAMEFKTTTAVLRSEVENFAVTSGAGAADTALSGNAVLSLALWLALLPVLLLAVLLLARRMIAVYKAHPTAAKIGAVVLLALLAMLLPQILDMVPSWIIPAKWSDFSHWAALMKQFSGFIDSIFGLVPSARDVILKKTLVIQVALAAAGCPLALIVNEKIGKKIKYNAEKIVENKKIACAEEQ